MGPLFALSLLQLVTLLALKGLRLLTGSLLEEIGWLLTQWHGLLLASLVRSVLEDDAILRTRVCRLLRIWQVGLCVLWVDVLAWLALEVFLRVELALFNEHELMTNVCGEQKCMYYIGARSSWQLDPGSRLYVSNGCRQTSCHCSL